MRIDEFDVLTDREKMDLLHKEAVYIGKRRVKDQVAILFQLETFYVEVFYKEYRAVVDHILINGSTDILTPYLNQIDNPVGSST